MTPKEKAEELINKFAQLPEEGTFMWYVSFEIAKKCALIAVDEIIKNGFNPQLPYNYYQEVKQEIDKL